MAGRPKKQLPLPEGFHRGGPVKVTTPEYRGIKLGLLIDVCKYKDDGFTVLLTGESSASESVYVCVKPSEGDLLEVVEI